MKQLSRHTIKVLDDLHEQLCRNVPLIGGFYLLRSNQINALRVALPHVLRLSPPPLDMPDTIGSFDPWEADSGAAYIWPRTRIPWHRRARLWWMRQIENLGEICDE